MRVAAGKPAAGAIQVRVLQESNDITVTFSDDGAGLDLARIRSKAEAKQLIESGAAMSDADAANLIFMPGFSTADEVTELSGRGVGMDVVRAEVHALGGRIETQSQANAGTSFKLVLPLTTAVTQVVILRMGDFSIGVPANIMETVLRVPCSGQLKDAYAAQSFSFGDESVPFFWGGALLQVSAQSEEMAGKTLPVAIFRSAGQRLAVHVDEVLGNREVVVKNLGPTIGPLARLGRHVGAGFGCCGVDLQPGRVGIGVRRSSPRLGDAAPGSQCTRHRASRGASSRPQWSAATQLPLVLVVDDSITVRRVTQRLLKREGYRVALANDGLQALERLQEEVPAVVLSDIEMPRMDGFDLARNIRADAKLRGLPIIMITSRIAEKHREHARELGVDHYLGKPYSEDELLGLVRAYCSAAVPA